MTVHGFRPEFQPQNINAKARQTQEANAQADRPVRGHDDVVPQSSQVAKSTRLLDIRT